MLPYTTELPLRGPPADGGYPVDSDLHQMTDDGCPLSPDPNRWADVDWRDLDTADGRDNLGELDTFDGDTNERDFGELADHFAGYERSASIKEVTGLTRLIWVKPHLRDGIASASV